ncbi:endochitinase-like isoform X2 [Penaeus chinensis]|uniref:endochitinase-like isoform X1 n=1 Tax=Penaeus chinensis TaxID=139456 RepID=UPI001FB7AB0D|nr:endochitinase-like isoform X1 [Penaeus chinensis]XP_047473558.1 endochitinase-like isoform X2 [Penaeus chinensis]
MMKYMLILVLAVAGSLAQEYVECDPTISEQCPLDDGEYPVFFPDPNNCAAYCECSGGTAWHLLCAPGTVWDIENNMCNWSDHVDCQDRPIVPPVS